MSSESEPLTYLVQDIFETVQGEATWTGTPAVFVRLQGCVVGCPWCDTKETWSTREIDERSWEVKARLPGDPTWARLTTDEIVAIVRTYNARHVVITGGEPCAQDIAELCGAILRAKRSVQVETSGTYPVQVPLEVWVTVSPKVGMPGGREVLTQALHRANEIKAPIGRADDVDVLLDLLRSVGYAWSRKGVAVWLQPLSLSRQATALCVKAATDHGWKVSVQTHKLNGWR